MARFRRSGTNWEGRRFYTTVGLNALLDEIEAAYPNAGPGDGTVASEGHDTSNPGSDHRPHPFSVSPAVVRAVDAGEYIEDQGIALADALRKSRDPRIKYVIHEGRMFSSYSTSSRAAWAWGPYSGINPHKNHAHVSVTTRADTDGSRWNLGLGGSVPNPPPTQEDELAILSTKDQEQLKLFLDSMAAVSSGPTFPKYLIPWFRKLSTLSPEALAELEESDEIDALEARIDLLVANTAKSLVGRTMQIQVKSVA